MSFVYIYLPSFPKKGRNSSSSLSIKWPTHPSSCSHPGTTCRPTAGLARYRPASPSWGRGVDDHPRTSRTVTRQTVGSNGQFLIPHQNGGCDKNCIIRNCEDICIWLIFDRPLQNLVHPERNNPAVWSSKCISG